MVDRIVENRPGYEISTKAELIHQFLDIALQSVGTENFTGDTFNEILNDFKAFRGLNGDFRLEDVLSAAVDMELNCPEKSHEAAMVVSFVDQELDEEMK